MMMVAKNASATKNAIRANQIWHPNYQITTFQSINDSGHGETKIPSAFDTQGELSQQRIPHT